MNTPRDTLATATLPLRPYLPEHLKVSNPCGRANSTAPSTTQPKPPGFDRQGVQSWIAVHALASRFTRETSSS